MCNQGHREGGSGTPIEIFSIELSQEYLHSHKPPVLHNYQAICKHMHTLYLQHVMATHIQLASDFRALARFHHNAS